MAAVIEIIQGSSTIDIIQAGASATVGVAAGIGPQGIQGIQGIQGPTGTTDFTQLVNVPSTFTPSAHTHIAAEVTDFSSAASSAAPVQSVAGRTGVVTLSVGDVSNAVSNTDARLSDARTPLSHTHVASAITDFNTAAASAAPVQSVAGKVGVVTLAKADVGLGNVDNTSDLNKPVSTATQTALDGKAASSHTHAIADVTNLQTTLDGKAASSHTHPISAVTNLQSALDGKAASSHSHAIADVTGLQTALDGKQASGSYATLVGGLVPSTQLPSYVDDVVEAANLVSLPVSGETGKIYVTLNTNKTYRWSGSAYVEIAASPGSTDSVPEGSTNLYHTTLRAAAAAPVQSVAGRTGAITLAVADVANAVSTSDSRLTDARTPTSHTHGNITNAGAVGTVANLPLRTGTSGVIQAGAFGTSTQALGVSSAGSSNDFARADHVHAMPSAANVGAAAASHTHTAADIDSESADAGYVLTADGDGGASWEAATGGSPSSYEIKTESFTASVGGRYACDTSAGEVVPSQAGQWEFYGLRVLNSDEGNSPSVYINVAEQSENLVIDANYILELYVNQDETTYDTIIEFINDNGGGYGLSAELVDGYDGSDLLPPYEFIEDNIPQATPESFAYDLFEVTPPESPNSGDSFTLADAFGTWANNAPVIVGLEDINGNPPPLTLDINGIANLVYVSGVGWKTLDSTKTVGLASPAFSQEPATGSTSGLVTWGGGFDTTGGFANNVFVVPAGLGGLYMFNAAIFYNQPENTQMELGIYVDGIRVRAFYTATFDGEQGQAQVFGVVDLDVGNTVDVRVNFFGDPDAYVRDDVGVSWFTGVKL